jgi:hypothetical protein
MSAILFGNISAERKHFIRYRIRVLLRLRLRVLRRAEPQYLFLENQNPDGGRRLLQPRVSSRFRVIRNHEEDNDEIDKVYRSVMRTGNTFLRIPRMSNRRSSLPPGDERPLHPFHSGKRPGEIDVFRHGGHDAALHRDHRNHDEESGRLLAISRRMVPGNGLGDFLRRSYYSGSKRFWLHNVSFHLSKQYPGWESAHIGLICHPHFPKRSRPMESYRRCVHSYPA